MTDLVSFDWFVLFLRIALLLLLYLFLWQLVRVMLRELLTAARRDESHATGAPRAGRLIVLDPADSSLPIGATLHLVPPSLLGRHQHCDIIIDEPHVSGEHAEIRFAGGQWFLRDLGSTNGTLVNGQLVNADADIEAGDVVQFGDVKLEFMP